MPSAMSVDWSELPDEFWHCYVKLAGSKAFHADGIANDLTLGQIRREVVRPWLESRPFSVGGTIVKSASDVSEIKVVRTVHYQKHYSDEWEAEMRSQNVRDSTVNLYMIPFWPENSTDYTNEFLFREAPPMAAPHSEVAKAPPAKAFIVHGHDKSILNEVARFVGRLGIEPVILMEEEHRGRTLIEKLEQDSDVGYAVILATSDDVGGMAGQDKLEPRPRQNVVLEVGYFIGAIGRDKVCVLKTENVEMPSDLHGVGYHNLDAEGAWKMKLALEMKAAGLPVDLNKLGS